MKQSLTQIIVIAVVATAPVVAFAQSRNAAPVTRNQVRNEIAQLEKAGYSPTGSNVDYPSALQTAEARAGEQKNEIAAATYGGTRAGASEAGSRPPARAKSLYLDNANSLYVGD